MSVFQLICNWPWIFVLDYVDKFFDLNKTMGRVLDFNASFKNLKSFMMDSLSFIFLPSIFKFFLTSSLRIPHLMDFNSNVSSERLSLYCSCYDVFQMWNELDIISCVRKDLITFIAPDITAALNKYLHGKNRYLTFVF